MAVLSGAAAGFRWLTDKDRERQSGVPQTEELRQDKEEMETGGFANLTNNVLAFPSPSLSLRLVHHP
jgi:hypothetical protein